MLFLVALLLRASMDFSIHLECDKLLGAGTSGKVYRVASSIDGCSYAVKRIQLRSAEELEVAKLEVSCHSLFRRASVVGYRYAWVEPGSDGETDLCILLDLVGGELWDALLEQPPSPAECASWSSALLDALAAVHEERIVHRDLSPWNCFISTAGATGTRSIQLGDFGLAARLPQVAGAVLCGAEQPGCPPLDESALGSPFSAPELGSSEGYAQPVDVFSCGLALFSIWDACGAAREADDDADGVEELGRSEALMERVEAVKRECKLPSSWLAPVHVANLIARMVQRDPTRRPTAVECLAALHLAVVTPPVAPASVPATALTNFKPAVALEASPPHPEGARRKPVRRRPGGLSVTRALLTRLAECRRPLFRASSTSSVTPESLPLPTAHVAEPPKSAPPAESVEPMEC